jgi:hypothetical protein
MLLLREAEEEAAEEAQAKRPDPRVTGHKIQFKTDLRNPLERHRFHSPNAKVRREAKWRQLREGGDD